MPQKRATTTSGSGGTWLIEMNNPTDKAWQKTVRSSAARSYYTKAKQQQAWKHQSPVQRKDGDSLHPPVGKCTYHSPPSCVNNPLDNPYGPHEIEKKRYRRNVRAIADPERFLRIEGVDPFDTLVRRTTRFENYLLDHCKSVQLRTKEKWLTELCAP